MHVLRRYVGEIQGLAEFLEAAARNPVTQGVLLDVNPIWFTAYCAARSGLRPGWLLWDAWFWGFPRIEAVAGDAIDFGWIDMTGWVDEWTHRIVGDSKKHIQKRDQPFLVKAIARPVGSDQFGAREELVALVTAQSFLAVVETRPLGRLAVSSGESCLAAGVRGTVGGFLRDQKSGKGYAATCGHVAQQGATVSVSGTIVGQCSFSKPPIQLASGQLCTPGCQHNNRLDFALIDTGNAIVANTVQGVAAQIASRQGIFLRVGTGVQNYEVGGLMMTYCPGNSNVCFENMFEVRPRNSGGILHPGVQVLLATVPTQGDSGAWIETTSSEWCGVLVAADGLMGYALEADDTVNEADKAFGTKLQLL